MDRNQANEKIEKLLRLANNKGATSSERDTALEMATKLASKHGFRIQKAASSNSTSDKFEEILNNIRYNSQNVQKNRYEFDLNCFNKKFVSVYYKLKKESNLSESSFFGIFTHDFMIGVNKIDEEKTHFIKAYMLGREYVMSKFF